MVGLIEIEASRFSYQTDEGRTDAYVLYNAEIIKRDLDRLQNAKDYAKRSHFSIKDSPQFLEPPMNDGPPRYNAWMLFEAEAIKNDSSRLKAAKIYAERANEFIGEL